MRYPMERRRETLCSTRKCQALPRASQDGERRSGAPTNPEALGPGAAKAKGCGRQDRGVIPAQKLRPNTTPSAQVFWQTSEFGMLNAVKSLLIVGAGIAVNLSGWAQDLNAPKAEYVSRCAACHGDGGKGDGPPCQKRATQP